MYSPHRLMDTYQADSPIEALEQVALAQAHNAFKLGLVSPDAFYEFLQEVGATECRY